MSTEELTTDSMADPNPGVVPTYIPGLGNVGQVRLDRRVLTMYT